MAEKPSRYINMFKELGIDTRSPEEQLKEMQRQQIQRGLAAGQLEKESFRGERDLRQGGSAIGAAIGAAIQKKKNQLSPDQQRFEDARKYANDTVGLMEAGGKFGSREDGTFDATAYGEARLEKIAEHLMDSGDLRGLDIAGQLYEVREARNKDSRERAKHKLDMDTGQHELEKSQWQFEEDKFIAIRGQMHPIFEVGNDDPNSGREAFIDRYGTAHTRDDNGELVALPIGSYVTTRPKAPKGGQGGGTPLTPTAQEKMRAQQRAIMMQLKMAGIMADALATAREESPTGRIDIMDGSGKFMEFSVNLANNVNSLFSQGEQWIGLTDGDPKDKNSKSIGTLDGSIASTRSYIAKNKEFFDGIPIPEGIERGSPQAARYQAAIVQLAYAKARSNEPGARQLSDEDFKRAITQIGAATTHPDTLRQVLLDNISSAHADFEFWRKQVGEERYNDAIRPDAHREYMEALDHFNNRFAAAWGTAADPQGALAQPPETDYRGTDTTTEAPSPDETVEERRARLLRRRQRPQ